MVDTNKKLPKHGWDDEEIVPKYGTTYGQRDLLGRQELYYSNPAEPENYSYQKFDPSGSYETLQKDKSKNEIRTTLHTGETRGYTAGSSSENTDNHKDIKVGATSRKDVTGDDSSAAGGKSLMISQKGKIESVGGFSQVFTVGKKNSPLAMTKTFNGTDGDQVCEHSGNWHEAFEQDHCAAVTGNKITMIEKGDYAVHIQKGGYDMQVSEGKLHLMSSGDDLIANSNVKVLLQVGTNAKVTVEPASIKLQVGDGSYIEITAGEIKMVSPIINLN